MLTYADQGGSWYDCPPATVPMLTAENMPLRASQGTVVQIGYKARSAGSIFALVSIATSKQVVCELRFRWRATGEGWELYDVSYFE